MSQKTNPISLRLQKNNVSFSCPLFADFFFTENYHYTFEIENYLATFFKETKYSKAFFSAKNGYKNLSISLFLHDSRADKKSKQLFFGYKTFNKKKHFGDTSKRSVDKIFKERLEDAFFRQSREASFPSQRNLQTSRQKNVGIGLLLNKGLPLRSSSLKPLDNYLQWPGSSFASQSVCFSQVEQKTASPYRAQLELCTGKRKKSKIGGLQRSCIAKGFAAKRKIPGLLFLRQNQNNFYPPVFLGKNKRFWIQNLYTMVSLLDISSPNATQRYCDILFYRFRENIQSNAVLATASLDLLSNSALSRTEGNALSHNFLFPLFDKQNRIPSSSLPYSVKAQKVSPKLQQSSSSISLKEKSDKAVLLNKGEIKNREREQNKDKSYGNRNDFETFFAAKRKAIYFSFLLFFFGQSRKKTVSPSLILGNLPLQMKEKELVTFLFDISLNKRRSSLFDIDWQSMPILKKQSSIFRNDATNLFKQQLKKVDAPAYAAKSMRQSRNGASLHTQSQSGKAATELRSTNQLENYLSFTDTKTKTFWRSILLDKRESTFSQIKREQKLSRPNKVKSYFRKFLKNDFLKVKQKLGSSFSSSFFLSNNLRNHFYKSNNPLSGDSLKDRLYSIEQSDRVKRHSNEKVSFAFGFGLQPRNASQHLKLGPFDKLNQTRDSNLKSKEHTHTTSSFLEQSSTGFAYAARPQPTELRSSAFLRLLAASCYAAKPQEAAQHSIATKVLRSADWKFTESFFHKSKNVDRSILEMAPSFSDCLSLSSEAGQHPLAKQEGGCLGGTAGAYSLSKDNYSKKRQSNFYPSKCVDAEQPLSMKLLPSFARFFTREKENRLQDLQRSCIIKGLPAQNKLLPLQHFGAKPFAMQRSCKLPHRSVTDTHLHRGGDTKSTVRAIARETIFWKPKQNLQSFIVKALQPPFFRVSTEMQAIRFIRDRQSVVSLLNQIIWCLEKRVGWRKIRSFLEKDFLKNPQIKGIRLRCSGRLGGRSKKAQKAKSETTSFGETSLSAFSSRLTFASQSASTPFGKVGVKLWICFKNTLT